jgi:hypothetical protein
MSEMRNAYKILVRKPYGKRLFVHPSRRFENNIKINVFIFITTTTTSQTMNVDQIWYSVFKNEKLQYVIISVS